MCLIFAKLPCCMLEENFCTRISSSVYHYILDPMEKLDEPRPSEDLSNSIKAENVEAQHLVPDSYRGDRRVNGRSSLAICTYLLGLSLLVISLLWFMLHIFDPHNNKTCVIGNERAYSDAPVIYESRTFHRAGFHDTRHQEVTEFEGRPNKNNNAAWEHLLSAGIITISATENERLSISSAVSRQSANKHVVELEVFHQLHCLKWLRGEFWELHDALATQNPLNDVPQRQEHFNHCVDYLRQVIMCHGDLTPITFEWNKETGGYLSRHQTEHQCRNFDAIFDWAKGRDTTGMHVDGNHTNVELEHPEHAD